MEATNRNEQVVFNGDDAVRRNGYASQVSINFSTPPAPYATSRVGKDDSINTSIKYEKRSMRVAISFQVIPTSGEIIIASIC
jgi:hypothetical protein